MKYFADIRPEIKSCPSCKADLVYTAIVKVPHGTSVERFSRAIGIYELASDRTVAYRCPECKHQWPRHVPEKE